MTDQSFAARLDALAAETETLLDRLLSPGLEPGETDRPTVLLAAMRHAMLGGGKRLRPFLLAESAALFSVPRERALLAGAALECIHGYSLVHDDLPAMDDDDLRRGRPTVHKAFDEATAILAGDALQTLAFDILSRPETHPSSAVRIELVRALARGSGLGGMAGGQMLDLAAEGRFATDGKPLAHGEADILHLQSMKTGALLVFACEAGAILAEASARDRTALVTYGRALGEAFQIADDILDATGDAATVGKATGKDAAAGKATLVGLMGLDGARRRLADKVATAEAALAPFGQQGATLVAAVRFVAERKA
jgi:farnesyl diphosphate synthase